MVSNSEIDDEIWKILLAVERYRYFVTFHAVRREIHQERNSLSLDDQCSLNGEDYTVGRLLKEIEDSSEVRLRFTEEVYHIAQNQHPRRKSFGIWNYFDAIKKVACPNTK